tara:strand:+ start:284 stop:1261 length:978 start_codon:yes stop_codon:yes gene_type:complete
MRKEQCYAKLNLTVNAGAGDVRAAYRKLAMIHHPDKGGDESTFKQINEAYDRIQRQDFTHDQRCGPFDEMFSHDFTNKRSQVTRPAAKTTKNQTIMKCFDLTLQEAYNGDNKKLSLQHTIPCTECSPPCDKCNACGFVTIEEHKSMGFAKFVSSSTITCPKCKGKKRLYKPGPCAVCNNKKFLNVTKIEHIRFPPRVSKGKFKCIRNVIDGFDLEVHVSYNHAEDISISPTGDMIVCKSIKFIESIFGYETVFTHPSGENIELNTRTLNTVLNENKTVIIEGKGFKLGRQLIFKFNIEQPKLKPMDEVDNLKIEECKNILKTLMI